MLTRAQVKHYRSLGNSAGRSESGCFLAEGEKLAAEWLAQNPQHLDCLIASADWVDTHREQLTGMADDCVLIAAPHQLAQITHLKSAPQVIAIAKIPPPPLLPPSVWCILMNEIQDPGNVGTILRIADWFGIPHVLGTTGCADYYSPKVVQAAMGAHLRVALHSNVTPEYVTHFKAPVIATALHGKNLSTLSPFAAAMVMIGNESRGLGVEWLALATHTATIPRLGGAESLNAGVAAGIIVAALRGS